MRNPEQPIAEPRTEETERHEPFTVGPLGGVPIVVEIPVRLSVIL